MIENDGNLYNDGMLFCLEACFEIIELLPETDLVIELSETLSRQLSICMKINDDEVLYKSQLIDHINECNSTIAKLHLIKK